MSEFTSAVEAFLDHRLGPRGHAAKIDRQVEALAIGQKDDALGDVSGQVAHPLQVVVDLQHGDDEPQIGGDRLVQGRILSTSSSTSTSMRSISVVGLDDRHGPNCDHD